MRGERFVKWHSVGVGAGSSPHARGTPACEPWRDRRIRFIPACAGNAGEHVKVGKSTPVHPRMRGERTPSTEPCRSPVGSSPHARGTRCLGPVARGSRRFIPACAGNASGSGPATAVRSVHPRMRGERSIHSMAHARSDGSSPHARGTPQQPAEYLRPRRFIPACAGNAIYCLKARPLPTVHPRMRGERVDVRGAAAAARGSSPHARGTLIPRSPKEARTRFIPACAGNAVTVKCGYRFLPVHPRMRGERLLPFLINALLLGSSPHARGTHFQ